MATKRPRVLQPIGWREWVLLPDLCGTVVKAKIDTGARTSSLHAFDLEISGDGPGAVATFEIHPIQRSVTSAVTVSHPVADFRRVRSSTGHTEERPVIRTPIRIGGREFDIDITLTSRDAMGFRMLLGRSAIRNRFAVDAGRSFLQEVPA
jgi:hypothetical protein